ncbi:MAG: EF-hand domain-containing protein [Rhodospirillaceae bacterium]|nr:EF-hand domain-containing protein [Rhodospirillaceae bacterium]
MTLSVASSSGMASTSSLLAQLMQSLKSQGKASPIEAVSGSLDSEGDKGLQELFSSLDSDGDGKLSATEFTNFTKPFATDASSTLLEAQAEATNASEKFVSLDTNGDGSLDQAEFAAGKPSSPPPPLPEGGGMEAMASDLFSVLDTDGNGTINTSELATALSGLSSDDADGTDAASLLAGLDVDSDGSISESELTSAIVAMTPPPAEGGKTTATAASGSTSASGGAGGSDASGEEEETSYDALDTNEDGYVSYSERLAGMRSSLSSLSAGLSDGTLSSLLQSVAMA